jgi:hypothetical protein
MHGAEQLDRLVMPVIATSTGSAIVIVVVCIVLALLGAWRLNRIWRR